MLPSFRFLLAAIVFSMSILVFGLGAAALLRTAHEEFASTPFWHAATETTFAPQSEPGPALALLRVDPLPAEQEAPDDVPLVAAPLEPAAIASVPAEPENIAALSNEEATPQEIAKPENPEAESPAQSETVPAQAEAAARETNVATEQALLPANEAAAIASEQTSAPASPETDAVSAKLAALDAPTVAIEPKPPKAANAKTIAADPDKSAIKRREQPRDTTPQDRGSRPRGATGSSAGDQPVRSTIRSAGCRTQPLKVCGQAGPVATGGPSGRPHSAHEPS
jgi:hypothetical protein